MDDFGLDSLPVTRPVSPLAKAKPSMAPSHLTALAVVAATAACFCEARDTGLSGERLFNFSWRLLAFVAGAVYSVRSSSFRSPFQCWQRVCVVVFVLVYVRTYEYSSTVSVRSGGSLFVSSHTTN